MKKLGYYISYYSVYAWMKLHALLPFWVLYILSDTLYIVVFYVLGYRKKVVLENLQNSFPDKSVKEITQLKKGFYHHFCDYLVETLKLFHISDKEMQKRMQFEGLDIVENLIEKNGSALLYMGHYCNWEWITSMNLLFDENTTLGQIYRPLRNKAMDNVFLKLRSRFGSLGITKDASLRTIVGMRRAKKKTLIGFMSDQTPSPRNIYYWTNFLNQDTAIYTGVERIAKNTGFGVVYLDIEKVKRGYYKAKIKLISECPKEEPEFAISERYAREMEKTIKRNPAYWLWTHRRWKWTREKVAEVLRDNN